MNENLIPKSQDVSANLLNFMHEVKDIELSYEFGRFNAEDAMKEVSSALVRCKERQDKMWQPYMDSLEGEKE